MWSRLRNAISSKLEQLLRWLTASALRSTAIFVILTFVPILLLTYYIVATSIRNSKADAANTDHQVRDFAVSLLRANFRGEREVLAGAADESSLDHLLAEQAVAPPPGRGAASRLARERAAARAAAVSSLDRLRRRRPEFLALALYNPDGTLLAASPPSAALAAALASPTLPGWFEAALGGQNATSPLLLAAPGLPSRIAFAVPVSFALPRPARGPALSSTGALVGLLPAAAVNDWVRHINLGPDRFLYLLDSHRELVSAPANGPFTAAQAAQLPAAAAALGGEAGSGEFVTAIQLESHAIAYAPLPEEDMALLLVR